MGSVYKNSYVETLPDGTKRRYQSKKFYLEFKTADGKRVRRPGYTDRAATEFLLSQLEQEAARVHAGMLPSGIALTRISLDAHLLEFLAYLHNKGVTDRYHEQVEAICRHVMKACGFDKWASLNAAKIADYLGARRKAGLSIRSSNDYLSKFRSFIRWLSRKVQAFDPLAELRPQNAATDRRRIRRSLTAEEFDSLIRAAEKGGTTWGLTGPERAMLYRMAAYTGLRAAELASLTPESLSLDTEPATVTVQARHSKHRREDILPIPSGFVADLREFIHGREGRLWPGCWAAQRKAADLLRTDLGAAALPYWDEQGRVFDFHSCRVFFLTSLARAGVPLTTAQKLARHSDPRLTATTYTKLDICDLATAVDGLASPRSEKPWGKTVGSQGRKNRKSAG